MSHVYESLVLVRGRDLEELGVFLRYSRVTGCEVKYVAGSKRLFSLVRLDFQAPFDNVAPMRAGAQVVGVTFQQWTEIRSGGDRHKGHSHLVPIYAPNRRFPSFH